MPFKHYHMQIISGSDMLSREHFEVNETQRSESTSLIFVTFLGSESGRATQQRVRYDFHGYHYYHLSFIVIALPSMKTPFTLYQ